MADIVIGRKEIMAALHVSDWGTVRRWKKSGLPVRYLPNRKPMILKEELFTWMVAFDNLRRKLI